MWTDTYGGRIVRTADELHAMLLRIVLDRALTTAASVNLRFNDG
jgi:hypothetical protein